MKGHQQFVAFAVAEVAVEYHHNRNRVVREKQSVASGDADRVAFGMAGSETSGEVGKELVHLCHLQWEGFSDLYV
jgi:hypothetical protein